MGLRSFFRRPQIIIVNYYAFVSLGVLHIRGRVLEDDKIVALPTDNWIKNLRHFFKRMLTNEIAHAKLEATLNNEVYKIEANSEGFYEATISLKNLPTHQTMLLSVKKDSLPSYYTSSIQKTVSTTSIDDHVMHAIVSDIDDTILVTGVVSWLKWRLLFNTLFLNAQKRKSFTNTSTFYKKLSEPDNPIFYISNSPWNLFDYLNTYLRHHNFPKGYIRLRDFNIFSPKLKEIERQNKYKEIIKALKACPGLPFILIGDAGEVDTDIYLSIASKYPGRIAAIYIRSVASKKRMKRINSIVSDYTAAPILVFEHTVEMESHAKSIGLIK